MKLSYLEAWDVKAHLIRIFGFGGWSAEVLSADLAFEDKDEKGRWNIGYKVVMRLKVGDATYTEAAVGSSTLGSRGDAHDMAVKTAESDALKRAAINLGTQFGLSLYDGGSRNDVVGRTMVGGRDAAPEPEASLEAIQPPNGLVDTIAQMDDLEALRALWDQGGEEGCLPETPQEC